MHMKRSIAVVDGRVRSGRKKRLYTPTEQKIVLLLLECGGTFSKSKRQICDLTQCCRGSVNTAVRSLMGKGIIRIEYRRDESGSCQANDYFFADGVSGDVLEEILHFNPYAVPR